MPTFKLTYFDMPGRVEPARVLFAAVGQPFIDERISMEQLGKLRESTNNPNQSLPILEVMEKGKEVYSLDQSIAIFTYLSRLFGLDGDTLADKGKVEEAVQYVVDISNSLERWSYTTEENKALYREKMMKAFEKSCSYLEARIKANMPAGNGFIVSSKLTFADIYIHTMLEPALNHVDKDLLAKYPCIRQCREKVASLPKIAEYLKKRDEKK